MGPMFFNDLLGGKPAAQMTSLCSHSVIRKYDYIKEKKND